VGYATIPPVAGSIDLDWSDDALADFDRFAEFLQDESPALAARVAEEIITRAQLLSRHPKLGRPISPREEYRQIVMQVLGGTLPGTPQGRIGQKPGGLLTPIAIPTPIRTFGSLTRRKKVPVPTNILTDRPVSSARRIDAVWSRPADRQAR